MDSLELAKPSPAALGDGATAAPGSCAALPPSTKSHRGVLRGWIGDRRVLAVTGLAVAGAGLGLGWDRLTGVGIVPLIVSAAPCLIMCAPGLCMMGRGQQACSSPPDARTAQPASGIDPDAPSR